MMPDADGSSVYDYVFSKAKGAWVTWTHLMEKLEIPVGAGFADILVPTQDSTRCVNSGVGMGRCGSVAKYLSSLRRC